MKRLTWILAIIFPLALVAADWNLVRVPAPSDPAALEAAGFQLFHRAGDYWIGSLPEGAPIPEGGQALTGYQPGGGDLYRLLIPSGAEADKLTGKVAILYRDQDEVIFQATQKQLETLPPLKAEWVRITLTAKPLHYSGVIPPATDEFHPLVQDMVNQVSQTQCTQNVQTLQDFITRNTRTANCDSAAAWILGRFQSFGLNAYYDLFTLSGMTKRNVIGELPGLLYPDSIVFVTGHYDATAGSPSQPEPVAPGADDNASGTAAVIECARILSNYDFEKTIRFCAFAGEEQGLVGSEDYVANLISQGARVVGSFNCDMIAWSGSDPLPFDLVLYSDNNPRSIAMANKVAEAVTTFVPGTLEPLVTIAPTMTGSDHAPFWDAGWPAICSIEDEAWGSDFNPYYHSVNDLLVNCDMVYATNCTRVNLAALADYAVPIVSGGPYLGVDSTVFDDIGGNNNGAPDPGETISILVYLINVGTQTATNISAILSTTNQYLTITQNSATYPDLNPMQTGVGSQPYMLNISSSCPQGTFVSTTLTITAAGGYQHSSPINFIVGDPMYEPTGPDAYGYYAYDIYDQNGPTYNWVEVDPFAGGPGTALNITSDDQTFPLSLPFTFTYYGQDYAEISVCSNGWIAMGSTTDVDWSNSTIPNSDGPPAMIAPFWEDLSPQQPGGHVACYSDVSQHYYVIEFDSVRQFSPTTARETFEVILHDPAYYPTPTGDGKILLQYKRVSDPTSCTVGIEDATETIGLQYLYNTDYDQHAAPLGAEMAVLFMTATGYPQVSVQLIPYGTPIVIPANGGSFNYNISATNNEPSPQTFSIWCDMTLPNGSHHGPFLGPVTVTLPAGGTIERDRTQTVPGRAPAGQYSYNGYVGTYPNGIWSQDSFNFTKLEAGGPGPGADDWTNTGESFDQAMAAEATPDGFTLEKPHPNPFNPTTVLSFELRAASLVRLSMYDLSGRRVAELINGWREVGSHDVTFDGSGLASGVYIMRFEAAGQQASQKMVLMK